MLCLTVRQPFASLILSGLKTAEYRSRPCPLRGLLGIYAGRAYPSWADIEIAASLLPAPVDLDALLAWTMAQPRGVLLGEVSIVGCAAVPAGSPWVRFGSWAWQLSTPRFWDAPVRAVGQLGLWHWAGAAASPQPSLFAS